MQAELYDRPLLAETAQSDVERDDADVPEAEDDDEQDDDAEGGEGEVEETEGVDGAPKKAKRVVKARQSLSEKPLGTTLFPIARVKKLIKADRDLDNMSSEATFMISVATEYFVKHFMEEGYTRARLDQRKIVTYKDLANLVARSTEFDFLRDVVPMPMSLSDALEARKAKQIRDENPEAEETQAAPASTSTIPRTDAAVPLNGAGSGTALNAAAGSSTNVGGQTMIIDGTEMDVDDLPSLTTSTNPLYPGAIIKSRGHMKARHSIQTAAPDDADDAQGVEGVEPAPGSMAAPVSAVSASSTGRKEPRGSMSRNGQTSPVVPTHSIGTRRSSRRSMAAAEEALVVLEQDQAASGVAGGVAVVDDDVPME